MIYRHRLKVSIGFSCATLVLHVIIVTAVVMDMMYISGHVIIVTAVGIDMMYNSGHVSIVTAVVMDTVYIIQVMLS